MTAQGLKHGVTDTDVVRTELLRTAPAAAYRATFAPASPIPVGAGLLPAGWEGLYFPFDAAFADLRVDGSPGTGDVVPDLGLPRRRYAGESTTFLQPLRYGDQVEQLTRLGAVTRKRSRTGSELAFVDIERVFSFGGTPAIRSVWHDVFLAEEPPSDDSSFAAGRTRPEPEAWTWSEELTLDSRHLFRFSAITYNTHRVHYDRKWATDDEGLDDLVVHGPLLRLLLLDFVGRSVPERVVRSFAVRALAPAYVDRPLILVARNTDDGLTTAALDAEGQVLSRGDVVWRPEPEKGTSL